MTSEAQLSREKFGVVSDLNDSQVTNCMTERREWAV